MEADHLFIKRIFQKPRTKRIISHIMKGRQKNKTKGKGRKKEILKKKKKKKKKKEEKKRMNSQEKRKKTRRRKRPPIPPPINSLIP